MHPDSPASDLPVSGPPPQPAQLMAKLRPLRERLMDISLRNRSLNYRDRGAQGLKLRPSDPALLFEGLVRREETFEVRGVTAPPAVMALTPFMDEEEEEKENLDVSGDDATPDLRKKVLRAQDTPKVTEARMAALFRKYRECLDSTGSNLCYLALGFLRWSDGDRNGNGGLYAPLVLVPVKISRSLREVKAENPETPGQMQAARAYSFTVQYDGADVEDNAALRLKLLSMPQSPALPEFQCDAEDADLNAYFEAVERMIQVTPNEVSEGWRVVRVARLAFFSSAKEAMYRDLDPQNWQGSGLVTKEWVQAVLHGREGQRAESISHAEIEHAFHGEPVPSVMDADSSQMTAMIRALRGQSMVIQGPPGTGKSQTITNLIAAALHAGRTVLFVSEKLAALSVVRERMEKADLAAYCLELHSSKATPKAVLAQVRQRLNRTPAVTGNPALQQAAQARMNVHRRGLEHYGGIICGQDERLGMPFYRVVWEHSRAHDAVEAILPDAEILRGMPPFSTLDCPDYAGKAALMDSFRVAARSAADGVKTAAAAWRGACPKQFPGSVFAAELRQALTDVIKRLEAVAQERQALPVPEAWGDFTLTEWLRRQEGFQPSPLESLHQGMALNVRNNPAAFEDYRIYQEAMKQWQAPQPAEGIALAERLPSGPEILEAAALAASQLSGHALASTGAAGLGEFEAALQTVVRMEQEMERRRVHLDELAALLKIPERSGALSEEGRLIPLARKVSEARISVWSLLSPALLRPAAATEYRRILEQAEALRTRHQALNGVLRMEALPDNAGLQALLNDVEGTRGGWLNRMPGTKGNRVRKALRVLIQPARAGDENQETGAVREALQWRADAAAFAVDPEARAVFGQVFAGLETNWETLGAALETAQLLLHSAGAENARNIIQAKEEVADGMLQMAETAKRAEECGRLLREYAPALTGLSGDRLGMIPSEDLARRIAELRESAAELLSVIKRLELPAETPVAEIPGWCRRAVNLQAAERRVAALTADPDFLGPLHRGLKKTDLRAVGAAIDWLNYIITSAYLPAEVKTWIFSEDSLNRSQRTAAALHRMGEETAAVERSLQKLEDFLEVDFSESPLAAGVPDRTETGVRTAVEAALTSLPVLPAWYQLKQCEKEMETAGGSALWQWCEARGLSPEAVEGAAEFAFWDQQLREMEKRNPALTDFSRQRLENHQTEFRRLDNKVAATFVAAIDQRIFCEEHDLPRGRHTGSAKSYTEMSLLKHEITKQKMHLPVRRLLHQSGAALLKLMPCWMMGPQAVAQFLAPEEVEFDLLIIDEASQVRPEDALGSLARAKQIIIVGDSKQMPPTDVFQAMGLTFDGDDDDGDENAEDSAALGLSSILDVFERQLPAETLSWHYRSRHQSLISFSNENFYDAKLIIPPSCWHDSEELGLKYHFLENGRLQNSRNPAEAEFIVNLMREHVLKNAGQPKETDQETLGVVAMNAAQQSVIQEKWEMACRNDEMLETARLAFEAETPLFIRNLENVQGDERDVIIISVTYGPNGTDNQVYQRFGPVNKAGGWRRLNVLFTRSKKRIHLVTSLKSTQVQPPMGEADSGRGYLRKYLQFAETGHLPDTGKGSVRNTPDSPFEESVARAIAGMGFDLHFQVGVQGFFIDIGVRHPDKPGEYICGIECDGAAFHSHPVARDRDRIRQEILEQRGWRIFRIWSTDWYRSREPERERLRAFLLERIGRTA